MIYPGEALFREVLEDVTGRACQTAPAFSRELPFDGELAQAFNEAHRALEEKSGALEAEEGMFRMLATIFARYGSHSITPIDTRERTAISRARDYLIENFASDIGLEEVAEVAGLSRAHLIRAFPQGIPHNTPCLPDGCPCPSGAHAAAAWPPHRRGRLRLRLCRSGPFQPAFQIPHRASLPASSASPDAPACCGRRSGCGRLAVFLNETSAVFGRAEAELPPEMVA